MIKTFTQTDAVRYVYGELNKTEKTEFESAMVLDASLRKEVRELKKLQKDLHMVEMKPSQKVIDNIINYSKSFNLHSK